MLVTDRRRAGGRDLVHQVTEAVRGGVGLAQVREKDLPDDDLLVLVRGIRDACPDVLLVVNGRPGVARDAGEGLHLPAAAPAVGERSTLPLVGRSAHSAEEARVAVREGADYLVLGTIFRTASKPGLPAAGTELVRAVSGLVAPLPVFGIGGIDADNAAEVLAAGAHGVAVCGAILAQADPRSAAARSVEATGEKN
jgi:thiamine-phosphate pyrophosphorylase